MSKLPYAEVFTGYEIYEYRAYNVNVVPHALKKQQKVY